MSTTTLPEPTPASHRATVDQALAEARERLRRQQRRARNGLWIETLGVIALLLVAYAVPTLFVDRFLRLEWIYRAVLFVSFGVIVGRVVRRRLIKPLVVPLSEEEMALAVERTSPELEQALISGLQFDRELTGGAGSIESAEMKAQVVSDVQRRVQSIPFTRAVDGARVRRFFGGIVAALLFFAAWAGIDAASLGIWAARNVFLSNVDWPRYTVLSFVDADEGVRLPQGDGLTVRVRVEGPVPDQMFLDYAFAAGETGTEPMSKTGDHEFSWSIGSVLEDVRLTVQGGDSLPVDLQVSVVERPRIENLAVKVTLPEYMQREPYDVPATEGELRLPKGSMLTVSGDSQKPLEAAFLLFGNDAKVPLEVSADGGSFRGEFHPERSGLLVVDVIDRDSLGTGLPPKLLLRVGEDQAPTIEFRLRGIGASITAHARIPGALRVRDDFGVRSVGAVMRVSEERRRTDDSEGPLPERPWQDAQPIYDAQLAKNALKYEAEASVDLTTWNATANENAANNPIRPGMLFSLRYWAKDNFGPGEPHEGSGETMTFRVVTREQLVEELRRRQIEQRVELQQVADNEAASQLELGETVNPDQAGDNERLAVARFKAMARRQQALGRRVRFVGEAYQRILWEYENNRLIEANKVRQIEAVITVPLEVLATEAFPATARLVSRFVRTREESVRQEAVEGYRKIERRLQAILKEMEQAENLAALLEDLRNVINLENQAIRDVKTRVQDRENSLFKPKKPKKNR